MSAKQREWMDLGMFEGMDPDDWTSSLDAADVLGWPHYRVLPRIDSMYGPGSGHTREFLAANVREISYADSQGREQRAYGMTFAGYAALLLRCSGAAGDRVREWTALRLAGLMRAEGLPKKDGGNGGK